MSRDRETHNWPRVAEDTLDPPTAVDPQMEAERSLGGDDSRRVAPPASRAVADHPPGEERARPAAMNGSASDDLLIALQIHPLLRWLDWTHVERVAKAGSLRYVPRGEVVVHEGEEGDSMYLIISGRTKVHKQGAEDRPLAILETGDFFGEMSLFGRKPRSATVTATDPTEVFCLPGQAVKKLSDDDPRAANVLLESLIRGLCRRLRQMNGLVSEVSQLSDWLSGSLV